MSEGVNKVILVGNLGADPELRYTDANVPVCHLSLATNERWKDKAGQQQERTEWHRVTVWGARAESSAKYLRKGSSVYIEGRLETRKWEDKDGAKRSSTDVVAASVVFLSGSERASREPAAAGSPAGAQRQERPSPPRKPGGPLPGDEDVPF